MHQTLADEVGQLAYDHHVAWNRMAVVLIQLGIPIADRLTQQAPAMLKDYIQERHWIKPKPKHAARISKAIDEITKPMALDARFSSALTIPQKERLRTVARRRGVKMSHVFREKVNTL